MKFAKWIVAMPALAVTVAIMPARGAGVMQSASSEQKDLLAKSRYAAVNGIRIHYLEWGTGGQAVVLIHGLYDNAAAWKSLAPLLGKEGHVLAPDLRGAGETPASREAPDPHTHINDLMVLIWSMKLGPVALIGHSAGAEIALQMATQHPEAVRSLVMVDGGFWPPKAAYHPETLYPRVSCPVLLVMAQQDHPDPALVEGFRKQGIDYFEQIKKSEQHVRDVAETKLRYGRMIVIKDTSHWIQKDQPGMLAQAIREFLLNIQGGRKLRFP